MVFYGAFQLIHQDVNNVLKPTATILPNDIKSDIKIYRLAVKGDHWDMDTLSREVTLAFSYLPPF